MSGVEEHEQRDDAASEEPERRTRWLTWVGVTGLVGLMNAYGRTEGVARLVVGVLFVVLLTVMVVLRWREVRRGP